MTRAIWSAVLSHWRRMPLQLFTLVMGLALATALWSGVQAINAEARASYAVASDQLTGGFDRIERADGGPIAVETFVALRRAGWLVSPVIEADIDGISITGIDVLTMPDFVLDQGTTVAPNTPTLWVAENVKITSETVTTVVDAELPAGTAVGDIGVVSDLTGADISYLVVNPVQTLFQEKIESISAELVIIQATDQSDIARLTDSFHLNLTAFGLLSFVVGIFIVHGAVGLIFEQRRPLVRTLRSVGAPLGQIITVMALELLVIAILAGAIGVILGYFIASALLPDVAATLRGLYGAEVGGTLTLRPIWWISGLGIAVVGAMIASIRALFSIARMPILKIAQPRSWAMQSGRGQVVLSVISIGLIAAAGMLSLFATGLLTGFAILAALLIGAASLVPVVWTLLLAGAERSVSGPMASWFWADTRQQMPGLSLALAALMLAMAANIGVSTMVGSFRNTFQGFLDQRLASEVYIDTKSPEQGQEFSNWAMDRVDAVLPIDKADVTIDGIPAQLYGPIAHQTYRDNWTFLSSQPEAWETIHAGHGAAINEQLSYRGGYKVGDTIMVAGVTLPVVGVYGDYGNPIGQVIIGRDLFMQAYPDSAATSFGIRIAPDRATDFMAEVREEFGLSGQDVIDQSALKSYSMEVFERTFTVTASLNVLTLGVAGFAMLMSLLTLAGMRLPQLAPVWAIGLDRRQLGWIELARAVILAVGTAVIALPVGLALAWVLLAVVNVAAFGWRLPMQIFPMDYAVLGVQAVLAAVIAAIWPAVRIARMPPAELTKVFANER